jgi:hypothetical protein
MRSAQSALADQSGFKKLNCVRLQFFEMQKHLLSVLQSASENTVSDNPRTIRPYLLTCMESLEEGQKAKFKPDQLLAEIQGRCARNAGSNPITQTKTPKAKISAEDAGAIQERHAGLITEIQDRIHHDIELAIDSLGLKPEQLKRAADDDNAEEESDDFFVEEAPKAAVIRHK